ncbi:MAG: Omp28-related outer membrane protein [Planctomycetes bacterium]|nr:Omp28-related outer membrane protein [Planctomycetota bacterium]
MKLHTGDSMEIGEESVICATLGLSGVPTASVNRRSIGGSVFLNRGDWRSACVSERAQRAKAEVDCYYTLDRATRTVRIQVVANITEAMNLPLRFNAFIMEDEVTGTGSGYDQKNFYSNLAGMGSHPYYNKPPVLIGYKHMKVVRRMLGGAWGVVGPLRASVKAGELYSHTFTSTLDAKWNMDKLWFVGLLQVNATGNKEIVNSAVAVKDGAIVNCVVDSGAPATKVMPAGSSHVNAYTLENATDAEQTYTVTLSATSRTPGDWSAQFASGRLQLTASCVEPAAGHLVVPARATVEMALTLKIGSTLGLGDAKVVLALEGMPALKRSRLVTGVSSEIQHLLLETGTQYSLRSYLSGTVGADAVIMTPSDYLALAGQFPNVNLVIWNKGAVEGLSAQEMDVIKNTPGVRTFLCGDGIIGSLSSSDLSYLGLQGIGWNPEGQTSPYAVWLAGQERDVIGGELGESILGHLIAYCLNMVKITDPQNVFPILHFQNNGQRRSGNSTYAIAAQDAILGVRSTRNSSRTVLLGISPYVIDDTETRQTLIRNVLDWLAQ